MACERTSETIKIESLKVLNKKRWKSCSVAKICYFSANRSGKFESFGSGTSGNDVDIQSAMSGRQIKD